MVEAPPFVFACVQGRRLHCRCHASNRRAMKLASCRGAGVVLILALLTACARETYQPKPIDPAATEAALAGRTLAAPAVRDYFAAQGRDVKTWPPERWDLGALTLAAVFLHPEIDVARARAELAAAEKATSRTALPYTLTARPEYNSAESGGDTPWGYGLLVGLPIDLGNKRGARTEQLARLEEAARLEVAVASWRVRSRLRRHFVDLHVANQTVEALEAEQAERGRLLGWMEKRVAAGMAARGEVSSLRLRQAEGELALRRAVVRREQALAGVAESVAVPMSELRAVRLDFSAVDHAVPAPEPPALQRVALLNRIDLRRKLADYAVAEAAVKLEVARQYPDITLVPGYFWDADESIWSIAGLALVPPRARTRALIREAELRREIEARAFLAVQSSVIAEAQGAAARYGQALAAHEAAVEVMRRARERRREAASQFERGQADRVDVASAALEAVVAERTAIVAMLELQQGLSALEDAVQRPLDNPDLFAGVQPAAAPADATLNPALIDND